MMAKKKKHAAFGASSFTRLKAIAVIAEDLINKGGTEVQRDLKTIYALAKDNEEYVEKD